MALGSHDYAADPNNSAGNGYTSASSGTSFSTPLTAGVCALLLSYNPGLTNMQIRDALRNTAFQHISPDRFMGWGIVDALAAAQFFPLPVELTTFTGKVVENTILLNWSTATEINNRGFDVQKKDNNGIYYPLSFVTGHGTSVIVNNYTFTDPNPVPGMNAYRLRQVDNNGNSKFSNEISINFPGPGNFTLYQNYPNPFNPTTRIRYFVPIDSKVKIVLFNILGNELKTLFNGNVSAGDHQLQLSASDLSSGVYFVKLSASDFQKTIKIILTK
jgi:hypothetical protein